MVKGDQGRAAQPCLGQERTWGSGESWVPWLERLRETSGRRRRNSLPGREALVIESYPVFSYFLPTPYGSVSSDSPSPWHQMRICNQ